MVRRTIRRRSRRRFRPRRNPAVYIDEIQVKLDGTGTIYYNTTDVRFNSERAYKIISATLEGVASNYANLCMYLFDPLAPTSGTGIQGAIASTGIRSFGVSRTSISVRNRRSTDFITPSGPTSNLIAISLLTGTSFLGNLKVRIQLGTETFAVSRLLTNAPLSSPNLSFENISLNDDGTSDTVP